MELVFNHDSVVTCEYKTYSSEQCKENPLMQIWKDFNKSDETQLKIFSGSDEEKLDSQNILIDKKTNVVPLNLDVTGKENNCFTGLSIEF